MKLRNHTFEWVVILAVVFVLTAPRILPVQRDNLRNNLPDTIQEVMPSVVHIVNKIQGWQGSGVAISKNIILTARHVVENGDVFTITLNDGMEIKASEAVSSKKYDLGFIRIEDSLLEPARLGSMKDCRLGQQLFVIGSPFGKLNFNSVTLGILSGLNRDCDFTDWQGNDYGWHITFQTDAAGHPGNSGCPVFSMDGRVRGILVGGFSPVLVYCVPVDLVMMDLPLIDIMFALDQYSYEEAQEQNWDGYNQEYE